MKKYKIKTYLRNERKVFLDLIRNIFVIATDEEKVRQETLLFLLKKWKIPSNFIEVEQNLSHYKKGARKRADIIIKKSNDKPFILFELKAPSVYIDNYTLTQALEYNKILKCKYICLSNGDSEEWYRIKGKKQLLIEKPKSFKKLLKGKVKFKKQEKYDKLSLKDMKDPYMTEYAIDFGAIGEDTPNNLHSTIINFYSLLQYDEKHFKEPVLHDDFELIENGIRRATFGNAAGGSYGGWYRYYILKFPDGNNNIVSFGIFGLSKLVNDPKWGNRNSYTSLIVAIDDFDKRHNSLQLNLDKNLIDKGDYWLITHEGKLTSGKKGAIKQSIVKEYCKQYLPDIISDDQIILGKLPKNKLFTWKNSKDLIINLIRYALLRDKIRKEN